MTKDFSRFAPKEVENIPLHMEVVRNLMEDVVFWQTTALIGWILFLLTAFHNYVLPHLI